MSANERCVCGHIAGIHLGQGEGICCGQECGCSAFRDASIPAYDEAEELTLP